MSFTYATPSRCDPIDTFTWTQNTLFRFFRSGFGAVSIVEHFDFLTLFCETFDTSRLLTVAAQFAALQFFQPGKNKIEKLMSSDRTPIPNVSEARTHRFPRTSMPLRTFLAYVAFRFRCWFIAGQLQTLRISQCSRDATEVEEIRLIFLDTHFPNALYSYPFDEISSHCTVRVCVPFLPHGAEHFDHSLSLHFGGHEATPHCSTSLGRFVRSHKVSSALSNVDRLLHVTVRECVPLPQLTEHGLNAVTVQEYVSGSVSWADDSGTLYS